MNARKALGIFALVGLVVAADQWTKRLAEANLRGEPMRAYAGGFFKLLYAQNTGAFGSLGEGWPPALRTVAFVVLPVAVLLGLVVYLVRTKEVGRLRLVAMSLVVAGGAGNLVDRIRSHYVVDFLWFGLQNFEHFGLHQLGTNIFNVADVALMVGIGLLLVERKPKEQGRTGAGK